MNDAYNRSCWGDYDISTNYYDESPDTGVVREFWWEITNTTAAPDGVERVVLAVNSTVPGPTLYGDWGDIFGKYSSFAAMVRPLTTTSSPCDEFNAEQRNRNSLAWDSPKLHKPNGRGP